MKCVILAAGYATRLYPLTERFPKPLLDVGGKPILDWLVDDVSGVVESFSVVSNHKFAGQFSAWAASRSERIEVIDDGTMSNEERLGAVRDLQLAVQEGEDHLVMAGDNMLDFSMKGFIDYATAKGTSCVMCHEEHDLAKLRKTGVITLDEDGLITDYQEKPDEPRGHFAVPPFYVYRARDIARIGEALDAGCNPDAPGSFAVWLSKRTGMHAWIMPGKRYDIGDAASYEYVRKLWER